MSEPAYPGSLGMAKPKSFGEALRAAIKEEFGTSKAFAQALRVSQGRVSQLIGGTDAVDASTLTNILRVFPSEHLREALHSAWIREFAPLPREGVIDQPTEELLSRIDSGVLMLSARQFIKLLDSQREREADFAQWFLLSERLVHLYNRRCEGSRALRVLQEMEAKALSVQDALAIAKVLWMRSVVLRNIGVSWQVLEAAHRKASEYRSSTQPAQASAEWRNLEASEDRDHALAIVSAVESGQINADALRLAERLLTWSQAKTDDVVLYYSSRRVRADIALASGNLMETEDLLEELRSEGVKHYFDLTERLAFLSAGIHLHRGRVEEAVSILDGILVSSQAKGDLHHARKADSMLASMYIRELRR